MSKDLPSSPQQHDELKGRVFYTATSQSSSGHTNALAESFNAALKVERVHRTAYPTRKDAMTDVASYIEIFYNHRRIHSGLDYRTPHEVRNAYENPQLAA